jgi:sulfur-oxidizing protein SoxB
MSANRRTFIKNLGAIGGTSLLATTPLLGEIADPKQPEAVGDPKGIFEVSILQTTDVHCQIHPHDELFWENNQMVFSENRWLCTTRYLVEKGAEKANSLVFD